MKLNEIFGPKAGSLAHTVEQTMMKVLENVPQNGFQVEKSGRDSYVGYTIWFFEIKIAKGSAISKMVDTDDEDMKKALGAKAEKLQLKAVKDAREFVLELMDAVGVISKRRDKTVSVRYIGENGEKKEPAAEDITIPGRFGLRVDVDFKRDF